jgi:tetratricopeptide (TPR) repeat protein
LTVNFDNLLLRALALFNNFPVVYDLAVLKDATTPTLREKSVVYLHGQYHETWQLSTAKEIEKANEVIPPLLNSINNRPWIFVGYSGDDHIFNHIARLNTFNQGLFWVTHGDNLPNNKVSTELLEKNSENTFLIKGYDADAFMLKLNAELKLPQPDFIDRPFTSLKHTLENLVDIENHENFKGVKERLEIAKKYVGMAQLQFEDENYELPDNVKNEIESDRVKKQIIDMIIKEEFNQEEIYSIEESIPYLNNQEIKKLMAALFNHWGIVISRKAKQTNDEALFIQGIEKFKKGTELNPENDAAFYNWGSSIFDLAKLRNDGDLFEQSVEKYKIATKLNPSRRTRFL